MPTIKSVTVHSGAVFGHPYENYANFRPGVSITAEVAEGEESAAVVLDLQGRADAMLQQHRSAILARCKDEHEAEQARAKAEREAYYARMDAEREAREAARAADALDADDDFDDDEEDDLDDDLDDLDDDEEEDDDEAAEVDRSIADTVFARRDAKLTGEAV